VADKTLKKNQTKESCTLRVMDEIKEKKLFDGNIVLQQHTKQNYYIIE
jgi:hypothetical protein